MRWAGRNPCITQWWPATSSPAAGQRRAAPADSAPPVSVIVPAYNAQSFLPEQLAALMSQDAAVVREIVVADNGSTDRTHDVAVHVALQDRRIRVVDASGRRGAAHARNVGAAAASGDFFAFCDADDVVAPGWAAALYACARRTGAQFIAGVNDHDTLYPYPVRRWRPAIHPSRPSNDTDGNGFAEACNLGVSRAAFDSVDGFDESLAFAAEDVELSWQLQRAGFRLERCTDAVVYYRDRVTASAAAGQAYRYGRGNTVFLRARDTAVSPWWRLITAALPLMARTPALFGSRRARVTWLRQAAFWAGGVRGLFDTEPPHTRHGVSGQAGLR
ncbi:glycosyltransferase [Leekyejoonella antrihumi]|uniref:Glycosyltransferase n=1 Tax=Leekyejoonella antrihumi TaxID=1660198 RepID=A0A563E646_9MICO|nr:glycosyltransferase [Leekyejoonella antrihumi]TWP37692.1 glycosyltransferase [Leekyejoonella antrihumi]